MFKEIDTKIMHSEFEKGLRKLDTMSKDLLNSVDQLKIIYDEKSIVGLREILAQERQKTLS